MMDPLRETETKRSPRSVAEHPMIVA